MTDLNRCQYICPRKQRQCKILPSTHLSTYCMEHILHDPNLDEVDSILHLTNKNQSNITDEELQEFIIRIETIHDNFLRQPLENIEINSNCYLSNVNLNELGNRTRKHLEQIGSIINQLFQLNLLQANTCFVEMGAGRGQLSHELHACLKQESTVNFILIERDHQRY